MKYGSITEQGDLGLGFNEIPKDQQQLFDENAKRLVAELTGESDHPQEDIDH